MRALVLVDIQSDFLPGGALSVPGGDEVVPVANRLMARFELVVATQDWHPRDHASFAANHPGRKAGERITLGGLEQILWPVHCVQHDPGAEFAAELEVERFAEVFHKGTDPQIDSYSGFFDNGHRRATGLGEWLKQRMVSDVYLLGLATDYCVKFTALDARQLGFETHLVADGCRSVDLAPGDGQRAITEMQQAGVRMISSSDAPRAG